MPLFRYCHNNSVCRRLRLIGSVFVTKRLSVETVWRWKWFSTGATLGSTVISCRRVCPSVRQFLLKRLNVGSCNAWDCYFLMPKNFGKIQTGSSPTETPNAGAVAENWRLSIRSVVNIGRSQVHHTGRPPYVFAARSPWCCASRAGLSATAIFGRATITLGIGPHF